MGSQHGRVSLIDNALEQGRTIYGFDSFEGFPEPTPEDDAARHGIRKGRYATTDAAVLQHLQNSGISREFIDARIKLSKGFFEDTVPKYDGGPIALLHLDGDLYQSYKVCLEHLYPLVQKGGIIAFDEYQSHDKFPGCKRAVDEALEGKETIRKSRIINRYYVVKGAE